jgi:hypothetical protein
MHGGKRRRKMPDPFNTKEFEKKLKSRLFRFDCPVSYDLGDYEMGLISDEKKKTIEAHLEGCPLCRKELRSLRRFIEHDADKPKIEASELRKPRSVIPFPRNETRYVSTEPKAAVRGATASETSRLISISYGNEKHADLYYGIRQEGTSYALSGQFITDESFEKKLAGASIEIWENETISATLEVDEFCSFKHKAENLGVILIRVSNEEGTLLCFNLDLGK